VFGVAAKLALAFTAPAWAVAGLEVMDKVVAAAGTESSEAESVSEVLSTLSSSMAEPGQSFLSAVRSLSCWLNG
jgi:hypothetical protein